MTGAWPRPTPTVPALVSYSLWSQLRSCRLRAAFHLDRQFGPFRRPSPASVLGSVRHRIAEMIARGDADVAAQEPGEWFDGQWSRLVAEGQESLLAAWSPAHPPAPGRWPGYEYLRASARVAAVSETRRRRGLSDLAASRTESPVPPAEHAAAPPGTAAGTPPVPDVHLLASLSVCEVLVEEEFTDQLRGMYGRLDRVERCDGTATVTDLKSGVGLSGEELVARHRDQMLFYASLVEATWGLWPHLQIVGADNRTHRVDYRPEEVRELRRQVGEHVAGLRGGAALPQEEQAAPAAAACRYCPYQTLCRPFLATWPRIAEEVGDQPLTGLGVVHGRVVQRSADGTLQIEQDADLLCPRGVVNVSGLPASASVRTGDLVAVSGVRKLSGTRVQAPWDAILRTIPE